MSIHHVGLLSVTVLNGPYAAHRSVLKQDRPDSCGNPTKTRVSKKSRALLKKLHDHTV